ncbi:MAG: methyltransferase domain-containing protein [Pseudomonadota bacterium]
MTPQDDDAPPASNGGDLDPIGALLTEGAAAGERGDLAAAKAAFASAQAAAPDRIEPRLGIALVALRGGDAEAAKAAFKDATRRADAPPGAFAGLAQAAAAVGDLGEALAAYDAAAARWPQDPLRWTDLAAALAEVGRMGAATAAIGRALALDPTLPIAVANASRIFLAQNKIGDAAAMADAALAAAPDLVEGWKAKAAAALAASDAEACRAAFDEALRRAPDDAEARIGRGYAAERAGDAAAAAEDYAAACAAPDAPALAFFRQGALAIAEGDGETARTALGAYLERDPQDPHGAALLIARLGGPTPDRAPPAYIRAAFDAMAERFDQHLFTLGYDAPAQLVAACAAAGAVDADPPETIDLGCGTGMVGAALGGRARRLVGVDLAPRMVERAAARGGYDRLVIGDAVATLAAGAYDLAIAADTLIYIGDLDPVFAAAAAGLNPGGRLAATVEIAEDDVVVCDSGRFAHADAHWRAAAEKHGFAIEAVEDLELRLEDLDPVPGRIFIARKT